MKYLVLLLVVAVVVWAMTARRRPSAREARPSSPRREEAARPMLACAHCGVHLPRDEAVFDAGGRAYCGPAHRLAGPR